jgi:hypothetical protein
MSSNAAGVARNILHENVIGFPPAPGQSLVRSADVVTIAPYGMFWNRAQGLRKQRMPHRPQLASATCRGRQIAA